MDPLIPIGTFGQLTLLENGAFISLKSPFRCKDTAFFPSSEIL